MQLRSIIRKLFSTSIFLLIVGFSLGQSGVSEVIYGGNHHTNATQDSQYIYVTSYTGLILIEKSTQNISRITPENSSIPTRYLHSVCLDTSGEVWIGSKYGLIHKQGINYSLFDHTNSPIPDAEITNVIVDQNNSKWFTYASIYAPLYPGGLGFTDGASWAFYDSTNSPLPSSNCFYMIYSPISGLWLYYTDYYWTLYNYNNGNWTVYDSIYTLSSETKISPFTVDSLGTLYYPSPGGINKITNGIISPLTSVAWPGYGSINSLFYSNNSIYSYSTHSEPFPKIEKTSIIDSSITLLRGYPDTTPDYRCSYLLVDNQDTNKIWVITEGPVMLLHNNQWQQFYDDLPPSGILGEVEISEDTIYVAGGYTVYAQKGGLSKLTPQGSQVFTRFNSTLKEDVIFTIAKHPNGKLWIGTANQFGDPLYEFDGQNFVEIPYPDSTEITDIEIASNGFAWVFGNTGIWHYNGVSWSFVDTMFFSSSNIAIWSIGLDKDEDIWVMAHNNVSINRTQLWENDGNGWKLKHELPDTVFVPPLQFDPQNRLCFSSSNGIVAVTDTSIEYYNSITLGLPSDQIENFTIDSSGTFYIQYYNPWKFHNEVGILTQSNFNALNLPEIGESYTWNARPTWTANKDMVCIAWQDKLYIIQDTLTSLVDEMVTNFNLKVFPTITSNLIFVTGEITQDCSYTIYTAQGNAICSHLPIMGKEINVENLKSGIYFLQIRNKGEYFTFKFIKL